MASHARDRWAPPKTQAAALAADSKSFVCRNRHYS